MSPLLHVTVQPSDALRAELRAQKTRMESVAAAAAAARTACTLVGIDAATISITWLSDVEIASLNAQYLGHKGPTDVISFELYQPDELPVGDVYIGYMQAWRQSAAFGSTLRDELIRLAVHGTLHVLGFEHPEGEDRMDSEMWLLQEAIIDQVLNG